MATPAVNLDALLDAMTLEEQAALLSGADFWNTAAIARLGVPSVKMTDGPNGARGAQFKDGPATACFPAGIALAATWDTGLVEAAGRALGHEARLKGAHMLLAPTVNLQRTVYNGRNFECHSEDPWLSSAMAVAYVRGVQSTGVAATIKHYIGNESEFQRMTASSDIPERALRELYLLPFERAVKEAGVMAVMTGYNRVDGRFMADHHRLVTEVLREEWGFDGLVVTDWFATHDTADSVLAGCDLEMPGPARERGPLLVAAVRDGRVGAGAVRACARRVLQLAERVGRFADPALLPERADELPEHRALIRRLGAAGAVLLKNEYGLLPLALRPGQTVAVIGRGAREAQIMGGGSAMVNAHRRVAPLDALREALPGVTFVHLPGADLHRFAPVCPSPMALRYFNTLDLSGPVVHEQTSPNGEVMWFGNVPAGVTPGHFSCRATLRYVAEADGTHVFSVIAAGLARATLNGEPVLDAWAHWQRGDAYFTFGCEEVLHRRHLRAGDVVEIVAEFNTAAPRQRANGVPPAALRVAAARELDETDLAAAEALARRADLVLVFAGLNGEWDSEGMDRPGIALPGRQDELVARVAAANRRTVVVLQSGAPLVLPWLDSVPAVLQAWYPGQECGHAITDVLLGHAEPGGRLPQTWPARLEDTVAHGDPQAYPGVDGRVAYPEGLLIGYRHHDAHGLPPRFPFGHGLSYTSFAWSGMQAQPLTDAMPGATGFEPVYRVAVTITNTGAREGDVVVQLYLAPQDAVDRPPQALAGFAKLRLAPGQQGTTTIDLVARAFASYDEGVGWRVRSGRYELRASASAAEVMLRGFLTHA